MRTAEEQEYLYSERGRAETQLARLMFTATQEERVHIDLLLESPCFYPGCRKQGELYEQATMYEHHLSNFTSLCPEHRAQNDEEIDERWAEYRADVL